MTSDPDRLRRRLFGAIVVLLAASPLVQAEAAYKCRDASGGVAYQDRPCAGGATQSEIELDSAPPPSPPPEYSAASSSRGSRPASPRRAAAAGRRAAASEAMSFECRAGNGEVFYRHGACPKSIAASEGAATGGKRRAAKTDQVSVSAQAMSRAEACRRQRASSSGRRGHARDETVSTYERNLGRDPCR